MLFLEAAGIYSSRITGQPWVLTELVQRQEADDVVKLGIAELELRHLMPVRDQSGLRLEPDLERCRGQRRIAIAAVFLPNLADFRRKAGTLAPERVAVEAGVLLPDALAARHLLRDGMGFLNATGAHVTVGHEACEDGEESIKQTPGLAGASPMPAVSYTTPRDTIDCPVPARCSA